MLTKEKLEAMGKVMRPANEEINYAKEIFSAFAEALKNDREEFSKEYQKKISEPRQS